MGPACRFDLVSIVGAVWKSLGPMGLAADLLEQSLPTPDAMRRIRNDRLAGRLLKMARPDGAPRRPSRQGPPGQVGRARVTELWLCCGCGCGWLAARCRRPVQLGRRAGWLAVAVAGCGYGWPWLWLWLRLWLWLWLWLAVAAAGRCCSGGWLWLGLAVAVAEAGCGCDWPAWPGPGSQPPALLKARAHVKATVKPIFL